MSNTNDGQNLGEGQTPAPVPSEEKPTDELQDSQLPEEASERTRAEFEKLKQHNKQLAEQLAVAQGVKSSRSVLDDLRPSGEFASTANPFAGNIPTNQPETQLPDQFVDDGGYVDTALLNQTLAQARRQSEEARTIARQTQEQIQRFQETEQVKKAHAQYPQLDPNNIEQFDPTFFALVKNEMIGQMMEGKQDLTEAAKKISKLYSKPAPPVDTVAQEKQKQVVSQRGVASATTSTGKSSGISLTRDELIEGTRKGDPDAIFKRLQASGY